MQTNIYSQGPPTNMNNNMYSNPSPVSATTTTIPPTSKWLPFRTSILQVLPPGRYPVHQRASITPPIPEVALCPPQDQLLFSQVDEMERNFLDAAIFRKIMDMNRRMVKMVISYNGVVTGAKGQMLHVLKNEFPSKKQEEMRNSLGDLMAMAYDEILVPGPLNTDNPFRLRGCLQDHNYNYCPPQQGTVQNQPLTAIITPGASVQNR